MLSSTAIYASGSSALLPSQRNQSLRSSVVRCSSSPTPQNGGVLKSKGPVIIELPLEQIRRPLLRTRNNDPEKVKELMASIAEIGLQEPIDVLEVEGFYYGFSGCHRYEAHQRLGLPTIRCKVRRGTKDTLSGRTQCLKRSKSQQKILVHNILEQGVGDPRENVLEVALPTKD